MRYVCAIHGEHQLRHCFTDDPQVEARFAESWNKKGWNIYDCVAELQDGAQARSLDTVKALAFLHVDIDLRRLETSGEQILANLKAVPLPFELRDSGGGFHVIAWLKEPVEVGTDEFDRANAARKQLTRLLAADPAPDHAAALLRRIGTRNFKYDPPRPCRVVRRGKPVDLTEIEELIEQLGDTPLFVAKPKAPKANGHDKSEPTVPKLRIDVAADLASMSFQGPVGIHDTQLRCVASRLRAGMPVDDTVAEVLAATQQAVAGDPRCAEWSWLKEERDVFRMAFDFINKHHQESPELVELLSEAFYNEWRKREAAGDTHIQVHWSGFNGGCFCIRCRKAIAKDEPPTDTQEDASADGPTWPTAPPPKPKDAPKSKIRAIPFVAFDEAKLPPRVFLYGMHYQRGQCTCSVGQDGVGKSTVSIAEAIAMASGRAILGEQPTERCRVWLHNADDDRHEINHRIAACCRLHGVPMAELEGWLFVTCKDDFGIQIATANGQLVPDKAAIGSITETIIENQIDVAVFDPLVTLHGVAENDNVRMSEVIHILANIAAKCDCAIDLCHHTRKPSNTTGEGEKEYNSDGGAGAIRAAVRASRVFNRMSKAEADKAGLADEQRVFYLRIDRGKANYLPPAIKGHWYELKSVELLNGQNVGTIASWTFPGQDGQPSSEKDAAERAAEHTFLAILQRFNAAGRPASDRRGANYAPTLFSEEKEAKVAKLGKSALQAAMVRLLHKGTIRPTDERHGFQRVHTLVLA
jgi:RecA-family ATPase